MCVCPRNIQLYILINIIDSSFYLLRVGLVQGKVSASSFEFGLNSIDQFNLTDEWSGTKLPFRIWKDVRHVGSFSYVAILQSFYKIDSKSTYQSSSFMCF